MHVCASDRNGHTKPPLLACVVIERERLCAPVPHVLVHEVHADQADVAQCTGHEPRLHCSVSTSGPHAGPPCAASVMTLRARVCVPAAHVALQSLHGEKAEATQGTAQGAVLHVFVDERPGQAIPPCAASRATARVLVCTPPPQLTVHPDHALQVVTMQSTAHGAMPHALVSIRKGQLVPPLAGAMVTERERVCVPPPHVFVHDDHSP